MLLSHALLELRLAIPIRPAEAPHLLAIYLSGQHRYLMCICCRPVIIGRNITYLFTSRTGLLNCAEYGFQHANTYILLPADLKRV